MLLFVRVNRFHLIVESAHAIHPKVTVERLPFKQVKYNPDGVGVSASYHRLFTTPLSWLVAKYSNVHRILTQCVLFLPDVMQWLRKGFLI
jgi:hypothetical protein